MYVQDGHHEKLVLLTASSQVGFTVVSVIFIFNAIVRIGILYVL